MTISLQLPKVAGLKPRIIVIGVGGAGGNAVNNMIASGLSGVEFVAANTDAQALTCSSAERRIQLGANITEGLGAGSKPEIGEAAAEETVEEIRSHVAGAHMVFIAAGMGGGTGTGAAAVLARTARELGILTVGVVTKPFLFEGARRMRIAEAGIAELRQHVDTLIVIPNQNIFRIANERTTFAEAFVLADQVLYSGIACIVDLIVKDGLINLDFADVRTIMRDMGTAMMGTGEATGADRAVLAAEEALSNPLLDEISLGGAKGLLVSIIGGHDLTLYEVDAAANRVREEVDPDANIIVGASFDDSLGDRLRVAIVASGMIRSEPQASREAMPAAEPAGRRPVAPGAGAPPPPAPTIQPPPIPPQQGHRQRPAAPAGAQAGAAPTWRAPNDVMIEDGLPPMPAPPPEVPGQRHLTQSASELAHAPIPSAEPFVPAAPSEVRRGAARVPPIEEFPPIGQLEYRLRMAQRPAEAHGSAPAGGTAQGGGEPRRTGLLNRLVGRGRRGSAAAPEAAPDVQQDLPPFFDRERR